MTYTGTIATEEDITLMAGKDVEATANTEANHNLLIAQAEAYISVIAKYDVVTNWASINEKYKKIFTEWAARYCGASLIMNTTRGFSSLIEAEDMVQFHIYKMEEIEKLLNKSDVKDFIGI